MTPTLAPPVLLDPATGQRWTLAAETEHGPAYAIEQPPLLGEAAQVEAKQFAPGAWAFVNGQEGE